MEIKGNLPLVSVPVVTYNSSKYVIETLESIKAQTYQNLELIVSDDCSTDNTVDLCKNWIEQNKDRFVRTKLLTVEKNTGTSVNCNRAESECKGKWVKGIAGDDVLLPNCISDYVEYVQNHPNSIYVFARIKAFGSSNEDCRSFEEEVFNPAFFQLSSEQQLHKLIFDRNYIPSATCFYNRQKKEEYGIRNDERIPLLEDYPKWINILKKGIHLDFLDKEVVKYRISSGVSTKQVISEAYYRSIRLFDYYYRYPEGMKIDQDAIINCLVELDCNMYADYRKICYENERLTKTKAYRLGRFLLKPFKLFRHWWKFRSMFLK